MNKTFGFAQPTYPPTYPGYPHQNQQQGVSQPPFDFLATDTNYQHFREFDFDESDRPAIFPHTSYGKYTFPAPLVTNKDWECACPKYLAEQEHKQKNPLFAIQWMQGGKRVITGTSGGEIIIWNTLNFEFEKSTSVHKDRIQAMCWSNYEKYLISGDKKGSIIYSDNKISFKNRIVAHDQNCIRDLSFSLSTLKFLSCSDDRTAKVFDFATAQEEVKFEGHNSDVKTCHWHPFQAIVATGSKDNQVKIWDPKSGKEIYTLQSHNNTINQVRWNPINGNWLLTGSRDFSLKVHDIRKMRDFQVFQKHQDQVTVVAWHPYKEELFASASHDGQIIYWHAHQGYVSQIPKAHQTMIWGMAWHPLGHMIASTGNDHKIKFWGRMRPQDDKIKSGKEKKSISISVIKKALKIQHWFMKRQQEIKRKKEQQKKQKECEKAVKKSFGGAKKSQIKKSIYGSTRVAAHITKQAHIKKELMQKYQEDKLKSEEQQQRRKKSLNVKTQDQIKADPLEEELEEFERLEQEVQQQQTLENDVRRSLSLSSPQNQFYVPDPTSIPPSTTKSQLASITKQLSRPKSSQKTDYQKKMEQKRISCKQKEVKTSDQDKSKFNSTFKQSFSKLNLGSTQNLQSVPRPLSSCRSSQPILTSPVLCQKNFFPKENLKFQNQEEITEFDDFNQYKTQEYNTERRHTQKLESHVKKELNTKVKRFKKERSLDKMKQQYLKPAQQKIEVIYEEKPQDTSNQPKHNFKHVEAKKSEKIKVKVISDKNPKPRWGQRKNSWQKSQIECIQSLVEHAWEKHQEDNRSKSKERRISHHKTKSTQLNDKLKSPSQPNLTKDQPSTLNKLVEKVQDIQMRQQEFEIVEKSQAKDLTKEELQELEKGSQNVNQEKKDNLLTSQMSQMDDKSIFQSSVSGTPFKRMRRTRDERKKQSIHFGCDGQSNLNESHINISPVKKNESDMYDDSLKNQLNENLNPLGDIMNLKYESNQQPKQTEEIKSPKMNYLKVDDAKKMKRKSPMTNKEVAMNKENL